MMQVMRLDAVQEMLCRFVSDFGWDVGEEMETYKPSALFLCPPFHLGRSPRQVQSNSHAKLPKKETCVH